MLNTLPNSTLHIAMLRLIEMSYGCVLMPYLGICDNLLIYTKEPLSEQLVKHLAPKWEDYSGNSEFPVPHPTLPPHKGYILTKNLWDGEYGRSRKDLCLYMAAKLAAYLECVPLQPIAAENKTSAANNK